MARFKNHAMKTVPMTKPGFAAKKLNPAERHSPIRNSVGRASIWSDHAAELNGATIGGGKILPQNASANSAKLASGCQSVLPSAWMREVALSRPSAIHLRNSLDVIGPYCRPSPPMIL